MRGITQDYQLAGFRYPPVERFACKHWPLEGAIDHFQYLGDSRILSAYSNLWYMCLMVCIPGIPSFKDSSHFFDFISRLPRAGVGMVDVVEDHVE
jgi:hypothetical protein